MYNIKEIEIHLKMDCNLVHMMIMLKLRITLFELSLLCITLSSLTSFCMAISLREGPLSSSSSSSACLSPSYVRRV